MIFRKLGVKWCKVILNAKYSDLIAHADRVKHKKSSECFSVARQHRLPFTTAPVPCSKTADTEASLSMFVICHCSIRNVDHLTDLNKRCFKGTQADNLKLHRTKCNGIVKNILHSHFKNLLKEDIADSSYSLLVDESTDISVSKQLGVCIIYFSKYSGNVVSTFLQVSELDAGNASSIVQDIKDILEGYGLDIQKMRGIGCDNASVMTGSENGVFAILKRTVPHLLLMRCVCHSVQLAVSAAAKSALPKHLESLLLVF